MARLPGDPLPRPKVFQPRSDPLDQHIVKAGGILQLYRQITGAPKEHP